MNWDQLKTILWLRWRLMCNQGRRGGGLGAVITILIGAAAFMLAALCFAGGLFGAVFGLGQASPTILMMVWFGVTVFFLFIWMIGLLTELQRSETIDLQKLMHLPVALGQMFTINYLVSHFTFSIVVIVPVMLGLGIGLAVARGPEMILLVPLAMSMVFMVTAWTYCLRGCAAIDASNSMLADYQRVRRWLVWPDLDFPRTPTGKPRLAVISSRAAELLGSTTKNVIPSEARDLLSSSSSAASSESFTSFTSSTSFTSLPNSLKDLSSLDRVELLSSLEHRYNIELNETQFANAQSFADIQKLLTQPAARRSDYVYPRWTQRAPVRLLRLFIYYALTWPATLLLAHPRIRGREHLANLKGPVLFVANHTTRRADIGLILFSLPARFRHRLATAMGGEMLARIPSPSS